MQSFKDAGLDSLGAVEMRNALSESFNMELPASLAFDYPTSAALIAYLMAFFDDGNNAKETSVNHTIRPPSAGSHFHSTLSDVIGIVPPKKRITDVIGISCCLPKPAGKALPQTYVESVPW